MKVSFWVPFFPLLILCGCFNRIHEPQPTEDLRGIEVSSTEVDAGEPVSATMVLVYQLPVGSSRPSVQVGGVRMAACFNPKPSENEFSCQGELTVPGSLTLLEGNTSFRDVGNVEVKRGEEVRLEHTFTFTSTEPQAVEVQAVLQVLRPNDPPGTDRGTEAVLITFR